MPHLLFPSSFFFNDTATTEIYTLSLHDALPICAGLAKLEHLVVQDIFLTETAYLADVGEEDVLRSEEHTSELQSHVNLVCRLLLEKKILFGGIRLCPQTRHSHRNGAYHG